MIDLARALSSAGISARITGDSTTRQVLLAHSIALDAREFDALAARVSDRYCCIALNQTGHGAPVDAIGDRTTVIAMADELGRALSVTTDHAQRPVHVVGHSLGGAVAVEATAACPEAVSSLAIVASPARGLAVFAERADAYQESDRDALVTHTLARWFQPAVLEANEPCVLYARSCLYSVPLNIWRSQWRSFARWNGAGALASVSTPVIAIAGDEDVSTPPALLQEVLNDARRPGLPAVISPAAHMIPLEAPNQLASVLTRWWQAVDQEPGSNPMRTQEVSNAHEHDDRSAERKGTQDRRH